jgi:hypothetical protein
MAIKYNKWPKNLQTSFIAIHSEIHPNWDFWFENTPSGNPETNATENVATKEKIRVFNFVHRPASTKKVLQGSLGNGLGHGCQVVSFQTKNLNMGKFWRTLEWKMLKCFMAIWNILRTLGIFYDHLVHFMLIWYIFTVLVSCTKKNLATLPQDHFSDLNC